MASNNRKSTLAALEKIGVNPRTLSTPKREDLRTRRERTRNILARTAIPQWLAAAGLHQLAHDWALLPPLEVCGVATMQPLCTAVAQHAAALDALDVSAAAETLAHDAAVIVAADACSIDRKADPVFAAWAFAAAIVAHQIGEGADAAALPRLIESTRNALAHACTSA